MAEETNEGDRGAYLQGSIVRIKLHDFMTYTDCEFTPGPRLNLVIGPNGSGKSSIVCALALGLNGSPADLGRSSDIAKFVRHGQNKGYIEIELHSVDGKNPVIRREIKVSKKGTTNWFLNGKGVTTEKIKHVLETFKIQVGNLCQVLPQDRVGDFSKFDQYRLLKETILSTLGQSVLDKQSALIERQEELNTAVRDLAKDKNKLENDREENKRLEKEVARLKERETFIEKMKNLQALVPWLEFDAVRRETIDYVEANKKLHAELEEKQKQLDPLKQVADKLKAEVVTCAKKQKRDRKVQKASFENMHKGLQKVQKSKLDCTAEMQELEKLLDDRQFAKRNIEKAEAEVEKIDLALGKLPPADELNVAITNLRKKSAPLHTEVKGLQKDLKTAKMTQDSLKRDIQSAQRRLQKFQGQDEKNLQLLRKLPNFNRYIRTYNLIEKMREQKRFNGKVHGPILLELDFDEDAHAAIAEQLLPTALISMYVTENESDRDVLMKTDGVNVFNVDPSTIKAPRRTFDLSKYKNDGVLGYADELIKSNPVVLEAIRRYAGLDKMVVGNKNADKAVDKNNLIDRLTADSRGAPVRLVTTNTIYNSRKSKYGNKETVFSQSCYDPKKGRGQNQSRLFHCGGAKLDDAEEAEKQELETQLETNSSKLKALEKEFVEKLSYQKKKEKVLDEIEGEGKELEATRRSRKQLESRKKTQQGKLAKAQKDATRDFSGAIAQVQDTIKGKVTKRVKKIMSFVSDQPDLVDQSFAATCSSVDLAVCHGKHKQAVEELTSAGRVFDELKDQIEALEKKLNEMRDRAKNLRDIAQKKSPMAKYKEIFRELKKDYAGIVELRQGIVLYKERVDKIMENDNLIRDYKQRQEAIEKLEPKVAAMEETIANARNEIDSLQKAFETPVSSVIQSIGNTFMKNFQEISEAGYACAGEVVFNKNENDFREYGVGIRVRFRANQKMQQLSADVQSGGERSLSTFLYLLALQDLTHSPFRVVDEINQGMDAHKERLAFHRLIDASCRSKLPQYFLITPKLLRGLKYTSDVTICFVYNGPKSISQSDWNMQLFLKRAREQMGVVHDAKRRRIAAS